METFGHHILVWCLTWLIVSSGLKAQRLSSMQVRCSSDERVESKSKEKEILTFSLPCPLLPDFLLCISQGQVVSQRLSVFKRSQSAFWDECTCQFDTHSQLIKTSHACIYQMQDDGNILNSQEPIDFCSS